MAYDQGYKIATGWLGWPHSEAMLAPLPDILLAFDGFWDRVKNTVPEFLQAEQKRREQEARNSPEALLSRFQSMKTSQNRGSADAAE